jgi:hypothetical protein
MTARGIKKDEETKVPSTAQGEATPGHKRTTSSKLGTGLASKLKPATKPVTAAEDPNLIKEDILNEED